MSHQNGNGNGRGPMAVIPPAGVPIIGQPFELQAWWMNVVVLCKCDQRKIVVVSGAPGSAQGICQACGRVFVLRGLRTGPDGRLNLDFGIGQLERTPDEPPQKETTS